MATRNITLLVRVQGAAQSARALADTTASLHRMGQESRRTSDLVRNMSSSFSRLGNVVSHAARYSAFAVTALAAATVKAGISFNATMEASKTAFTTILGSKKAADDYVKSLVRIATETPFQLTDVIQGTRSLLAFGMEAKAARATVNLLGNAIATGMGGASEIERSTRALGQIQAAGVLHAQDLNQLIQANVLSLPKLASRLGKSTKEFRKEMSLGKITAADFFSALRDMWANDPLYKGAAEKAMRTFNGQVERMKDMFHRAAGAVTSGLFDVLKTKVLPAASNFLADIEAIFSYKEWTAGEKMAAALDAFTTRWKPLQRDFTDWWKTNQMTDKLKQGFEDFFVWLRPKLETFAGNIPGWLWNGFQASGKNTRMLEAWAFLRLFGIDKTLVVGAGGLLWSYIVKGPGGGKRGGKTTGGPLGGATGAPVPVFVTNWGGAGTGGPNGKKPGGGPVVVPPGGKNGRPPTRTRRLPKVPGVVGRLGRVGAWSAVAIGAYQAFTGMPVDDVIQQMDPTAAFKAAGIPIPSASERVQQRAKGTRPGLPAGPHGLAPGTGTALDKAGDAARYA
jgi:tape measure domain-containing protein